MPFPPLLYTVSKSICSSLRENSFLFKHFMWCVRKKQFHFHTEVLSNCCQCELKQECWVTQQFVSKHYFHKCSDNNDSNRSWKFFLHSDWSVSYRSEVKARQDVKPDIRQPPFTDYRQPPVDYRHPPVADYRQPPTLDYRHPPLLDYRQLATDARQFNVPEYRMPPVQVRMFTTPEYWLIPGLWGW